MDKEGRVQFIVANKKKKKRRRHWVPEHVPMESSGSTTGMTGWGDSEMGNTGNGEEQRHWVPEHVPMESSGSTTGMTHWVIEHVPMESVGSLAEMTGWVGDGFGVGKDKKGCVIGFIVGWVGV